MTDFVVFNELSLPLDDHKWPEQLGVFVHLVGKLQDNGVMTIRMQRRFQDCQYFTKSKSLAQLLGNISGDLKTRLRSILVNQSRFYESPLIKHSEREQDEELNINSDYFFEGERIKGGLACAHIWSTLALSFATHEKWSTTRIRLQKQFIDADECEVSVSHLSHQSHCTEHQSVIHSLCLLPQTPGQLVLFCEIKNDTFPYCVTFTQEAKSQLDSLESQSSELIKRLYELMRSVKVTPGEGIGKPELLKGNLSGYSSRRITDEHRLVYKLLSETDIEVSRCFGHYE